MRFRKTPVAVLGATIAATVLACGPEFQQMLKNRVQSLSAPIGFDFRTAVSRLASPMSPAASASRAAVDAPANPASVPDKAHLDSESAVGASASSTQAQQILAMRESADGDSAYALGKTLPEPLRLYTAAAVDFAIGMQTDLECPEDDASICANREKTRRAALRHAAARFQALLALPPETSKARSAWAAFSLGRVDRAMNRPDQAVAAFQQTRLRVKGGAADPQQLSDASLGEEARVDLEQRHVQRAVALYAEQASHGDDGAVQSLRQVAERLDGDPTLLKTAIGDRGVQRLMVAYALARSDEVDNAEPMASAAPVAPASAPAAAASGLLTAAAATSAASTASAASAASAPSSASAVSATAASASASQSVGTASVVALAASDATPAVIAPPTVTPAASAPSPHAAARRMSDLLDVILRSTPAGAPLQDADRLAALAYQSGRYDLATRFAAQSHSPLAAWVDAKLALRRGDVAAAAAHYAEAVHAGAAPGADGLADPQRYQLKAENGTLLLSRAEFTQALAQWWAVGDRYWLDLAYVAERVVTTDELKSFVEANVPADGPIRAAVQDDEVVSHVTDPGGLLRDLLARRLMRDGRIDDAIPFFHAPDKRWSDPALRQQVKDYAAALRSARRAWTKVGRAESNFEAATIAHDHGLDFWGYEGAPDGQVLQGAYPPDPIPPKASDLASDAELQRYQSTAARPDQRYHFRAAIVAQAVAAADDLPPRSQAFAAVMCQATAWTLHADDTTATRQLYTRYVKEGPHVFWASHFGRDCPAPNFKRAEWRVIQHDVRAWRRHHKPLAIALVVIAACLLGAGGWWWRTRRARGAMTA